MPEKDLIRFLEAQNQMYGKHLLEISQALLAINGKTASDIFGSPDDMKLRSSMTLFAIAAGDSEPIFEKVLDKYYAGQPDPQTVSLLKKTNEAL